MKRFAVLALVSAGLTAPSFGQDRPSPEQLARMYDDALSQLKAAQDRKNELATENQKLQKRLSDQEQQAQQMSIRLATLENRAYFLREHNAAWQSFIEMNPPIRVMWLRFFNATENLPERVLDLLGDGKWPFSIDP